MNAAARETGGQQGAKLYVMENENTLREFPLSGERITIGRKTARNQVDLSLEAGVVSRHHGEITQTDGKYFYRDTDSSNGTYINEKLYGADAPGGRNQKELEYGDVIRIGDFVLLFIDSAGEGGEWKVQPLSGDIEELNIGRRPEGDRGIALGSKTVSRNHASFFRGREGWAIIDHNSTNGVYLNNNRLEKPLYLNLLDVVRIGRSNFIFLGDRLMYQIFPEAGDGAGEAPRENSLGRNSDSQKEGQLVINIAQRSVWQRFKKLTLLKDINLTVNSGEMVLILGGSGAGKTTFMNAVMGYEKADGVILHGGTDIYTEYDRMKYEIGFVPQQDLLRGSDSVYDTLQNAARMKLPKEITPYQRQQRIEEVLELLGLQRERNSLVVKLSGGQRKRLSIAVEFIADPSLFFLDEPDSGLDGIMARSLMENLRTIADRGKIVMVITHGPDRAAELFDKVIVLAKSVQDNCGHLAFYGTVPEAYRFFETDSLEGVVRRINRPDEGGDGLSDYYIDLFQGGKG
ncbi:MAG: FHA domain-containing protein [Ruminococcus sp.]|jgi:ABC-type multidrug transport system ATPase subunit/pSer/pThr/pTyr-binding forkhead associated (FHA) protein